MQKKNNAEQNKENNERIAKMFLEKGKRERKERR